MFGPIPLQRSFSPTSKLSLLYTPQTGGEKEVQVDVVPQRDDLRTFRIIAAAYLLDAMPCSIYLNPPDDPKRGTYSFWHPPFHYDDKRLTDEEVFRTKHRISDFNILKLISDDREGALQFFRWKVHVEKHILPKITSAGDILECTTNEFDQRCHPPAGSAQNQSRHQLYNIWKISCVRIRLALYFFQH